MRTPSTAASGSNSPDVNQLQAEKLSTAAFPAPRGADFRVYFEPQGHAAMTAHAAEDVSVEICGVLVGDWGRDDDGPFVSVRNYIRCDSAAKKFAEVTFTHESWSHINREMDTKFQDQRIVGWYHSHPNFGIFLSDRDFFIQQNFFSGPGQIALVIDPVRKIEGVFEWRDGRTAPSPQYWVGKQLKFAPQGAAATEMPESLPEGQAGFAPTHQPVESAFSTSTTLLAALCLFLLGWMLSGWSSTWERRAVIEGTVAHFGIWKGLRPGLEEGLTSVLKELDVVSDRVKALSKDHLQRAHDSLAAEKDEAKQEAAKKVADKLDEDWKKARTSVAAIREFVQHLEARYAWTPEERTAAERYIHRKNMELSTGTPGNERSEREAPQKIEKKAAPDPKPDAPIKLESLSK